MQSLVRNASFTASVFFILLAVEVSAQHRMPRMLIAGGAVQTENAGNRIAGTIGQPIIGIVKDPVQHGFLGFWYNTDNVVVHVERLQSNTLAGFTLDEVYPNPVNLSSEAQIGFTIPSFAQVRLSIVDNQGRIVTLLLDETLDEGAYSARFIPLSLPSGLYYTVLQSGGDSLSKKLLLVR